MTERQNIHLIRWVVIGVGIVLAMGRHDAAYGGDQVPSVAAQLNDAEIEKYSTLLEQIQFVRARMELFRLQHQDRQADLARFASWEQLTQRTNANAEPDPNGTIAPLMSDMPRNALNGPSNVAILPQPTRPSKISLPKPAGFVFIEDRIFATDLSGNAIFDDAAFSRLRNQRIKSVQTDVKPPDLATIPRPDREAILARMLVLCESQFQLYKMVHNEKLPDLVKYPEWQQMTQPTDMAGNFAPNGKLGPYLPGIPRNPLTGFYRVALTTGPHKTPQQLKDEQFGFVLDPVKVKLYGVDENGKCLAARSDDPNNSGGTIQP